MVNCPNCGAEVAPTVLTCARCRMPLPPELVQQSTGWGAGDAIGDQPGDPLGGRPLFRPEGPSGTGAGAGGGAELPGHDPYDSPVVPSPAPAAPYPTLQQPTYVPPQTEYGWQTPPPVEPAEPVVDERGERQRKNTITLLALGAGVLAIALISAVVVAVSLNRPSADATAPVAPATRATGTAPAPPSPTGGPATSAAPTVPSTPATTAPSSPEKGPTTLPSDARWCNPTVAVPASGTSCEFAAAVATAVAAADPAAVDFKVNATSPVTKKDYTMDCVRNSVLITCTGGNNATVWIRNGG